jgi:small subunit ribosomal protein S16
MLKIRFLRTGKKNQPTFKIVVINSRRGPKSGRFVEEVGFFNPRTKEKILRKERIKYWLKIGAKTSPRVFNLLVSEKIIEGKKIALHKKAKKEKKESEKEKKIVEEEGKKDVEKEK